MPRIIVEETILEDTSERSLIEVIPRSRGRKRLPATHAQSHFKGGSCVVTRLHFAEDGLPGYSLEVRTRHAGDTDRAGLSKD